jgi:hypothetical protein
MVFGWDAYLIMKSRADFGFTWVPSALQPNISVAPAVAQPGSVLYDPLHPPVGSIKVSISIADYPPYAAPPPIPTVTELVGVQIIPGVNQYFAVAGDTSPMGTKFTDQRGQFEKFGTPVSGPFGAHVQGGYWFWWELVAPAAN